MRTQGYANSKVKLPFSVKSWGLVVFLSLPRMLSYPA